MTHNFEIIWADGKSRSLKNCRSVIALGTFDGVHIAHKCLLDSAIALKKATKSEYAGAWCFSQSPASVLKGDPILSLTAVSEKIRIMNDYGLDFVAVGDFRDYRSLSAEDFIDIILKDELSCVATICGFNHRFGHRGAGDSSLLKSKFGEDNVVTVNEIKMFEETVSSTAIRSKITSGEIEKANAMLGRRFSIEGVVVEGKKLGREMQFPTANLYFSEGVIIPRHGIYATVCTLENGEKHIGVSNVGIRPTISDDKDSHVANCETHICDFSGDLYGQKLKIEFCAYLREEMRFGSIDELTSAIENDRNKAMALFNSKSIEI